MPFLSRIRINPLRQHSQRLLSNPQAMHAAVLSGIAGQAEPGRVLWRLDADNPHRPELFVLTAFKPDWSHLIEQAGWPGASVVRDYAPLLAQIATGREFAFRLTASPVQNTASPQKPTPIQRDRFANREQEEKRQRGFRIGHRTAATQLNWFLQHTHRWGFEIPQAKTDTHAPGLEAPAPPRDPAPPDMRMTNRTRRSFPKKNTPHRVVLHTVTYEGILRVTDPAVLADKLVNGIGPAKAYGCGLLTLAPLPGAPHG